MKIAIKRYITSQDGFLPPETAHSLRAVGVALQSLVTKGFESLFGNWCGQYSIEPGRRALTDMALVDVEKFYSATDTKPHRKNTHFTMPNLMSVERLVRLYESDYPESLLSTTRGLISTNGILGIIIN